ncbi:hypothetical protein AV274_0828, partial [Blastocystis sp. ATCC 50177/Nand II]
MEALTSRRQCLTLTVIVPVLVTC